MENANEFKVEAQRQGIHILPNETRPGVFLTWSIVEKVMKIYNDIVRKNKKTKTLEISVEDTIKVGDKFGS